MTVLTSDVDDTSEIYLKNREVQSAAVVALNEQLRLVAAGGGERYVKRHHDRGRMLARERIELLVDRDAPFMELSALAAWGTEFNVGAAIITGVGVVADMECMIIARDPTMRGGTMNPYTLRKNLRALEIARVDRLPVVYLVESGGADLPTQSEIFVQAGKFFTTSPSYRRWRSRVSHWFLAIPPPGAPASGDVRLLGTGGQTGKRVPRRPRHRGAAVRRRCCGRIHPGAQDFHYAAVPRVRRYPRRYRITSGITRQHVLRPRCWPRSSATV